MSREERETWEPDWRARRGRGGPHRRGDRWGGGHRARRGDTRLVLLAALLDGPAHGYELMGRIEEQSGGSWRPSPGSVYPTLQLLEDEGLVRSVEESGRRVYSLTDEGRAQADPEHLAALTGDGPGAAAHRGLRDAVRQIHMAAKQVAVAGSAEQVDRAQGILRNARQQLYQLLGEE